MDTNAPLNRNSIIEKINSTALDLQGCTWMVGGSAALVLQGERDQANDIDIVQHTGPEIIFSAHHEKRMWSRYYPELGIDMHYSNPDNLDDYDKSFHDIIRAITYIDIKHCMPYKDFWIVTPKGGGLINWVHHFLEYGYNIERTIPPDETDEKNLKYILGKDKYETLNWIVSMNLIKSPKVNKDFCDFAKKFKKL